MLIVNGRCRGARGTLLAIDVAKFCARVRVEDGPRRGTELEAVEYEDICKLAG